MQPIETISQLMNLEEKRKVLLYEVQKIKYNYPKLAKLTSWGFWNGGEYILIDHKLANKIYSKLRATIKESNHYFLNELADFLKK